MNNNKEASKKELIAYIGKIVKENEYLRRQLDRSERNQAINFTGSSLELKGKESKEFEVYLNKYFRKTDNLQYVNKQTSEETNLERIFEGYEIRDR